MPAPYTGRCLCGAVRLTIAAEPLFVGMCWCHDCQRIACGSAVVAATFPSDRVSVSGTTASSTKVADSGNGIERVFCPRCGTQLLGRSAGGGDVVRVRVGALDDTEAFAPRAVIWADSAPDWAVIDPALDRYGRQPPAPAAPVPDRT